VNFLLKSGKSAKIGKFSGNFGNGVDILSAEDGEEFDFDFDEDLDEVQMIGDVDDELSQLSFN
jgi:hypothetical protein